MSVTSFRSQVMTPEMLAERWHCSARHVRTLITDGELNAFRVGKLWRIRVEDVEAYECRSGASTDFETSSTSSGRKGAYDADIPLEPTTRKRRNAVPRLDMPNSRARAGRR
ncbi:MAG: hypothetical protein CMJ42_18330 [Phyllobacteriaceae bacterium]|nr:hypothetical protein [Phyllobacteriaceae bacterium]MBA91104.1 hypothetical protein [Phyllobacteriaceae bacterium]